MTSPLRWEPDSQLVAAVLSMPKASRRMSEMSDPDRAWLVAGLTLAGMTAKDIAERLDCSLRLVRSIRAEDMTQVCVVAQRELGETTDELRQERGQHHLTQLRLAESQANEARLRMQMDQLLDKLQTDGKVDTFGCGHPRLDFNMYRNAGKRYCRMCRTKRQAEWRAETKKQNRLTCSGVRGLTTQAPIAPSVMRELQL